MLERFSWGTYISIVGTIIGLYYLVLVLLLARKGAFAKRQPKEEPVRNKEKEIAPAPQPVAAYVNEPAASVYGPRAAASQPAEEDNLHMPLVHDLLEEFKRFIIDISENSFVKEEVIMGIQVIVQNYKVLESTQYYKSINDYIKYECESYCSIALSEEDIRRIWLG